MAPAKQLRDERLGRFPHLRNLDSQLTLSGLHPSRAKPVAITIAIVAQAALALRPALISGPTEPRVELLLDRPLNDQPRPEPSQLGQHPRWVINQLARQKLV